MSGQKTHQELKNHKMREGKDPLEIMEPILLISQVKKLTSRESDLVMIIQSTEGQNCH